MKLDVILSGCNDIQSYKLEQSTLQTLHRFYFADFWDFCTYNPALSIALTPDLPWPHLSIWLESFKISHAQDFQSLPRNSMNKVAHATLKFKCSNDIEYIFCFVALLAE